MSKAKQINNLPVLPLRDVVVFPHMVIPLFVGRERSMRALELAMEGEKQILLLAQRSPEIDDPAPNELYDIGTIATVLQLVKLPDGTIKVLVEGLDRAKIRKVREDGGIYTADVLPMQTVLSDAKEMEVMKSALIAQFEQLVKLNRKIPPELMTALTALSDTARLADTVAAHLSVKLADKQAVLEMESLAERVEALLGLIAGESDVLHIEKKIRGRVKTQMEKSQREYYLNEQMKAIQKELGDGNDEAPNEVEALRKRIEAAGMPKPVYAKAKTEFNKLKMMSPMSAEATVVRNYLDWLINTPWIKRSKIRRDLIAAEAVLDADHYGLEKVKERIVEYLAVQQRVKKMKGPIMCLVGPPGVGKTSLGQSIARATNRKFVRISLGGVRDEAEIRGHRRTYIGSMPGRIVQSLTKVKTKNPLFMLDELDKMSADFRGDPSSALLEVLDPEQNHAFNDHYLEVDLDLSEIMFIATANSLNIPGPLLDRMEIIRIPGYTEDEKLAIARRYLLPKQLLANGLEPEELSIDDAALTEVIRRYTRESGVRSLERELAKICRKVVKELTVTAAKASEQAKALAQVAAETPKTKAKKAKPVAVVAIDKPSVDVTELLVERYLGVPRHRFGRAEEQDEIGLVTGLAWTEVGGEMLNIEASVLPGKGKMQQTGQLGDVMQESIHAALSVVRARCEVLGIDPDFHQNVDIHVHVPEGATPKDGPSAGIAMCTALVSALTKIPVRADIAMTGEITLRGRVLPIGGLKEKLLAAVRAGIKHVLIPEDNAKDLPEIPDNIKSRLKISPVRWIDQVLDLALATPPVPKPVSAKVIEVKTLESATEKDKDDGAPRPH
jgi:ATP-dependent Lon protease